MPKLEKFEQLRLSIKYINISQEIGILIHFSDTIYKTE
jgi:ABC-type antimicrobial peptide transport system ATPase subunit